MTPPKKRRRPSLIGSYILSMLAGDSHQLYAYTFVMSKAGQARAEPAVQANRPGCLILPSRQLRTHQYPSLIMMSGRGRIARTNLVSSCFKIMYVPYAPSSRQESSPPPPPWPTTSGDHRPGW